jgi:hypothetical protein
LIRIRWVLVVFSCAACGGHSAATLQQPPDESAGAGGVDDADPPTSAGATVAATGGAPSQPVAELAGAGDEAGAPGYTPHIGSGTRNCESSEYCFGLACYAPPSFLPTVCVANCETDLECGLNEICVSSAKLAPTCYARCSVPGDCEYHFDCLDFSGHGQLVCFPAGWASRRKELD